MAKIVIIDDEVAILKLLEQSCKKDGHEVYSYSTGKDGLDGINKNKPDLAIIDYKIGDISGLDIIKKCSSIYQNMPMIMITGHGSENLAVEALKHGAFDYLAKPFRLDDLKRTINSALDSKIIIQNSGQENTTQSSKSFQDNNSELIQNSSSDKQNIITTNSIESSSHEFIGESHQIKNILNIVDRIVNGAGNVLIQGEFGTGKQLIARKIHDKSSRSRKPFKILNCSSLPEEILEKELFGISNQESIFIRAQGGTVLLEEINNLPIRLQTMLDAYLENISSKKYAGKLPENQNIQFIASSSENLDELISKEKFRKDLYYSISIFPIDMPPLRERVSDISLLADFFLDNYAKQTSTPKKYIDKFALPIIERYSWPGNVGELQQTIIQACSLAESDRIRPTDLPDKVTNKIEITQEDKNNTADLPIGTTLKEFIKKQEKIFIKETLKHNAGSREKTASMLDVSIATLYRKMGLKLERDKIWS